MARKHLLDGLLAPKLPAGNSAPDAPRTVPPPLTQGGAIGSVSRSIEALRVEAGEARDLRAKLESGQSVIEVPAGVIDASIVADRLGHDAGEMAELVASIAEHGQQVPVLLRPHPEIAGRYQVAYGHRRVRAAGELGRPVRAVVRPLSDAELVVAQGQENNARTDLTFIERALFATRLEDAGFPRATIMAALGIDKTALSKLVAVVRRISPEVIEAIGPAPRTGRDRWIALAALAEAPKGAARARTAISSEAFGHLATDMRFAAVFDALQPKKPARAARADWIEGEGTRVARLVAEPNRTTLVFDPARTGDFARFVGDRLPELYRSFLAAKAG